MKKIIIIFLLASFISIAVFGFISKIYDNGGYVTKSVMGKLFPKKVGVEFAIFNLYAFKFFSKVILNLGLIIILIAAALLIFSFKFSLNNLINYFRAIFINLLEFPFKFRCKFYFWLSLHTNSPAFLPTHELLSGFL